ncbi:hypothetical protein FKM82_022452 [Ascaphus truei]
MPHTHTHTPSHTSNTHTCSHTHHTPCHRCHSRYPATSHTLPPAEQPARLTSPAPHTSPSATGPQRRGLQSNSMPPMSLPLPHTLYDNTYH